MNTASRSSSAGATSSLQRLLAPVQAQFGPHWQAMAPRERLGLLAAGTALLVLLLWMIAVQPALRTLETVPVQRAEIDRQWQQMQRLAAETAELRQLPPVPPSQAEAALRSATERLGNTARLNLIGDRATVTLNSVEGAALLGWLGEVRSAARGRVIEAQLDRKGSAYSGTVVISLGRTA
ncbi:MAG: type II secretion system protein GspM [Leptothrix sp. (in: b-proteobacteria)]